MKTAAELQKEIKDLRYRGENLSMEKLSPKDENKECRKIKARLKYLKPLLVYLESNPTKEFCESELKKTVAKLDSINYHFNPPEGVNGKTIGELKKSFDAEWGVNKIKTHIKNLKFILKK